jgi:hypothetical protein
VLDLDKSGPDFGSRALSALIADGAKLHGLNVTLNYIEYNWSDVAVLKRTIDKIEKDAVVAASSEAGLFEYGSDHDIIANLKAIRRGTPEDTFMVGSVIRDEINTRVARKSTNIVIRPFRLEVFKTLIGGAGWAVDRMTGGTPIHHIVSLKKVEGF